MSTPEYTQPNSTLQTGSTYKNNIEAAIAAIGNGMPCRNLGINYSAGTFKVTGANGTALSASNPAFVTFQSNATPGELLTVSVEADQDFIDDAGASEIVGNLFGFTTAVAITVDVPFFIYACLDDAGTAVSFALSRVPHHAIVPAVGLLGTPSSAIADTQSSMFFFDSITVANYDGNPCVCLGSIRMRMSASDDWTVQTLATTDGIGQFQENIRFTTPAGQFGANSGTHCIPNAGTAAVFTTDTQTYYVHKNGTVLCQVDMTGDGGTDGSGAVDAKISSPFIADASGRSAAISGICGFLALHYAGATWTITGPRMSITANFFLIANTAGGNDFDWSVFSNGTRYIAGEFMYKISTTV